MYSYIRVYIPYIFNVIMPNIKRNFMVGLYIISKSVEAKILPEIAFNTAPGLWLAFSRKAKNKLVDF